MEEIYTVYKGVLYIDSLQNYVGKENVSICFLLNTLNIDDIAKHVEENYYSTKWHFHYGASSMLKLTILKLYRDQSYSKTIASLTDEEALLLGFVDNDGDIAVPTRSTLHGFIKDRLGLEGFEHIMGMIARRILELTKCKDLKTDSTPLEASRYDKHSYYNPHYKCKMDKAHITMIGVFPLYMNYTDGLSQDSPELKKHIEFLKKYNIDAESYSLDAGYDSFDNYADIWYNLKVAPTIPPRCDAVINREGTISRIDHWVNKLWKKGGSIHMSIDKKLNLLYENGRKRNVGMYLRNQTIQDEELQEKKKIRQSIERSNGHTKSIVTFSVRKIQKESRELYATAQFVSYQLLMLANLQNGIESISLAKYF